MEPCGESAIRSASGTRGRRPSRPTTQLRIRRAHDFRRLASPAAQFPDSHAEHPVRQRWMTARVPSRSHSVDLDAFSPEHARGGHAETMPLGAFYEALEGASLVMNPTSDLRVEAVHEWLTQNSRCRRAGVTRHGRTWRMAMGIAEPGRRFIYGVPGCKRQHPGSRCRGAVTGIAS